MTKNVASKIRRIVVLIRAVRRQAPKTRMTIPAIATNGIATLVRYGGPLTPYRARSADSTVSSAIRIHAQTVNSQPLCVSDFSSSLFQNSRAPTIAMSGPRPVARQVRTQLACRGSAVRSIAWLGVIVNDRLSCASGLDRIQLSKFDTSSSICVSHESEFAAKASQFTCCRIRNKEGDLDAVV